eukprot:CAMPEP_0170410424 /NCGR_PEP_ID=MMETSP0117_2-20130122/29877_1 /TAXON_ID=400756 /ORGANISM="Durinskia baltica, Strain CSIRO CS-38" /LENGTH=94 /DNA_ID=CAMNT_0010667945 /DNA_START=461 /DNA_END=742 /DNA_ORIENTATION=-
MKTKMDAIALASPPPRPRHARLRVAVHESDRELSKVSDMQGNLLRPMAKRYKKSGNKKLIGPAKRPPMSPRNCEKNGTAFATTKQKHNIAAPQP